MFRWNLMVRTRFGSHRQETKARRLRKTVRLRLEALEDRTLPSASSLPVVTVASPPAAPQVAAITSFVDSMVQQRLQVIDTIVQDASNIWNTLGQEIVQEVAALQLKIGHILGFDTNTPTPSSNAAVSQPNSDSGAGQAHTSGSGSGSGATTTAHDDPHPRLEKALSLTDSGAGSGSGPYSGSATVTGKVWLDNDGDGSIDNNEMDYAGDTVYLYVSTNGGSTWSIKSSTTTSNATQGYNYSLQVAYGYPWPSSYLYKVQVGFPANFEATIPGTSQINAQGFSQPFGLNPGVVQIVNAGLASMTVNTTDDDPNGPLPADQNKVTLRDAIETGNNGGGILHLTTIGFTGNGASGTIQAEDTIPPIDASLTINGPGMNALTVNGGGFAPVFQIASGNKCAINNLTFTGGSAAAGGGGVANEGNLTLSYDSITKNGSVGGGGGIDNAKGATLILNASIVANNTATTVGGGIANLGKLSICCGSQIYSNDAENGGGLANSSGGTVVIASKSSIYSNTADKNGGGISNSGTVTLSGATIRNNFAYGSGGGIFSGIGGLTLTNGVTVSKNAATQGGGIFIDGGAPKVSGGTISSNQANAYDGAPGGGGGVFVSAGSLTLTDRVSISRNKVSGGHGGGIFIKEGNVTMSEGTIQFNTVQYDYNGGGIYNLTGSSGQTHQLSLVFQAFSSDIAMSLCSILVKTIMGV